MEKRYGAAGRQDGLQRTGKRKWELFYGFEKEEADEETGFNYHYTFRYQPTAEEIKGVILAQINANTDEKILSGFLWDGVPVWLSVENQLNYMATLERETQTGGAGLPVTFKFGTDDEPVYRKMETLEELQEFFRAANMHVQQCVSDGWAEKEGVDWSLYGI